MDYNYEAAEDTIMGCCALFSSVVWLSSSCMGHRNPPLVLQTSTRNSAMYASVSSTMLDQHQHTNYTSSGDLSEIHFSIFLTRSRRAGELRAASKIVVSRVKLKIKMSEAQSGAKTD